MTIRRENRKFKIRQATDEEVRGKNYYNYPLVFEIGGKATIIGSGNRDHITVFRMTRDKCNVILSTSERLGYAGIEIIGGGRVQEIFFQSMESVDCRKDFFSYTELNQAKILLQYLY